MPGRNLLRERPGYLDLPEQVFFVWPQLVYHSRLFDFDEYGSDSMRVKHGVYFLSLSDHDEGEVQRNRTIGGVDHRCSSAVRIDDVTPSRLRPTGLRWRAVDDCTLDPSQITSAIEMSHAHTTELEGNAGCGQQHAFRSKSVIAKARYRRCKRNHACKQTSLDLPLLRRTSSVNSCLSFRAGSLLVFYRSRHWLGSGLCCSDRSGCRPTRFLMYLAIRD